MQAFELEPLDTLFFRDARPMQAGAGSGGHGANWPLPTTLHEAFRSMLLHESGWTPSGKKYIGLRKRNSKSEKISGEYATRAFESLRVLGPFPMRNTSIYFPAPHDLAHVKDETFSVMSPLEKPIGSANFPADWLLPVAAKVRADKSAKPAWISKGEFIRYLQGAERMIISPDRKLWDSEPRIGIAIDPERRTTVRGILYASEHLRLAEGVRIWAAASLHDSEKALDLNECINRVMTFGGESRMCRILKGQSDLLANIPAPHGTYVKWVLATPAVFSNGWRPNWVREYDGAVMLRAGDIKRIEGESRLEWRRRVRNYPEIHAKLVAVRTPGPRAFSGWDLGMKNEENKVAGGPKATVFALPEGSVYYFEAENAGAAEDLVKALHGRTLSDFYGEKGMGLGFCGTWTSLR